MPNVSRLEGSGVLLSELFGLTFQSYLAYTEGTHNSLSAAQMIPDVYREEPRSFPRTTVSSSPRPRRAKVTNRELGTVENIAQVDEEQQASIDPSAVKAALQKLKDYHERREDGRGSGWTVEVRATLGFANPATEMTFTDERKILARLAYGLGWEKSRMDCVRSDP